MCTQTVRAHFRTARCSPLHPLLLFQLDEIRVLPSGVQIAPQLGRRYGVAHTTILRVLAAKS